MMCEIARGLDATQIEEIQTLEKETGLTVVAFSCRTLDPAREEKLRSIQEGLGPVLTVPPATPQDEQLEQIRALEGKLGLSLVAVQSQAA